jgi:subtilisin family serine protease
MRRMFAVLLLVVLLVAAVPAAAKGPVAGADGTRTYIVRMIDEPVVAYEGGIKGLKATAPKQGQKIDPLASAVVTYVSYLNGKHTGALNKVGGGQKLYDYNYSFNGFAANLTPVQATKLAKVEGVMKVEENVFYNIDTSSTPAFLGLNAPGGLWDQVGGVGKAGEGIIIGVIDSGIWPENLSFSDRTGENGNATKDGKLSYQQLPGWHGKCTPGETFPASLCNQKLIGAQYFNAGWGGNAAIDAQRPWEFNSARDYNGHGSHTSSTAGGNNDVQVTGPGAAFGTVSGMAPRARIAMYKALWSTQDGSTASGNTSDLVAAIDQAVADGVDVINYSISGSLTNFLDPVMVSYLYATRAGIFVAVSAGNSGPVASTVAHPSPWVTTVAAGTHNRSVSGSVTLGNDMTYYGASIATAVGPAPLIVSTDAGLPGANATAVRLCYAAMDNGGVAVLDPAKVAGKIVVCDRGTNARVNKSLAVKEAGGIGMVLVNVTPNTLNADFHTVPTVHLQSSDRAAVLAYASTAGATATINKADFDYNTPAPYAAAFSSRGPLLAGGGDLLKPDLMSPGVDILAAVSPASSGLDYNLYSGTSMASPHVAGLAALFKNLHPDWTPMMIKSALMTSAYDILDGSNTDPLVIFAQGAGFVKPNAAANPGLVYNSGWNDWLAFLCGTTNGVAAGTCTALKGMGYLTDPSDFNSPSIAIGDLAGVQTVTRKVTNTSQAAATYTASYTGMAGFDVKVTPATFTINPGKTQTFTVKFTRTTADPNTYTGGQLTWTDGTHIVRIPMVVNPVALAVPAAVSGTGGAISYNVTFGYDGPFTATARGLVPAVITPGTVADDPTDGACSLTSPNAQLIPVAVPAGTTYARFSLFDADVNLGSDMDLCVFNGTTQVGSSGSGTSAEEVNLINPEAATYTVVVQGWGVAGSSPFKLHTWLLGADAAGNMAVSAPAAATIGTTGAINLTFSSLTAGTKYLGAVVYSGAAGMPNPTIVRVDVP